MIFAVHSNHAPNVTSATATTASRGDRSTSRARNQVGNTTSDMPTTFVAFIRRYASSPVETSHDGARRNG